MKNPSTISTLLAMSLSGSACAADIPIAAKSIEVRLFLADTGQFSEPINETSVLWNTIIGEGDATRPSTSTLVKVLVSGPRGGFDKNSSVSLTVAKPKSREKPITMKKALGVFNAEGKQYVAFWLPNTGCEELRISARVGLVGKSVHQEVPFECGE
jgi:hypothetical protein